MLTRYGDEWELLGGAAQTCLPAIDYPRHIASAVGASAERYC